MKLAEIKAAVLAGKQVCWANEFYRVCLHEPVGREKGAQWLVEYVPTGQYTGLTLSDGVTLNGQENQFYLLEDT